MVLSFHTRVLLQGCRPQQDEPGAGEILAIQKGLSHPRPGLQSFDGYSSADDPDAALEILTGNTDFACAVEMCQKGSQGGRLSE